MADSATPATPAPPPTPSVPRPAAPPAPAAPTKNRIGLTLQDYKGLPTTLCPGCGHDSITNQITRAFYELGIQPHRVLKLSGIGCSSKTPAYFLGRAFGFNAVHGRMPSIATGAAVANRSLISIGVSGDGDTASIGLGQFMHMLRRNVPCIYIIENNGVYGLTKGQFSATADVGSVQKKGAVNELAAIDCCALAIELGCGFVARSFSGDAKQLNAILRAALSHRGMVMLDVISPCVTFNDHEGSTKSYSHAKSSEIPLHEIGFVPFYEEIKVDYEPGTTLDVAMPDGSHIRLKKLGRDYNPSSKMEAFKVIEEGTKTNQLITGILYLEPNKRTLFDHLELPEKPLVELPPEKVRPGKAALDEMMEALR
ncbi:MAG: 2-oxoacid:ferredoxin oxidoreductase subunit beta [Planctomycetes bacterium]|nr:2-oxoacid:ferredoxin oxidoreductase subunit beta [Planctomycetota bacterium]